jgi:hypothetical protein
MQAALWSIDRIQRFCQHAPDLCERKIEPPLRQAELRHAGLGFSSSQARLAVSGFCLRELAVQPL